jgi:hypothetical protein
VCLAGRGGGGREPGVRETATLSRPDGGRSDFSPAVFLAGWAKGQVGQTQLLYRGVSPPQHAHLHYPDKPPSPASPPPHTHTLQAEGVWRP